jgi:DNA-binding transcriptional LysR family regulator
LYSFIKVAERGSITKAAGDLYLTQQAVSKQMLLVEELNLNLFNRSHNAIVLTRDGETLVGNVGPFLENIQESLSQL